MGRYIMKTLKDWFIDLLPFAVAGYGSSVQVTGILDWKTWAFAVVFCIVMEWRDRHRISK